MARRSVTEAEIRRAARTAGIPEAVLRIMLFKGERSGANSTSPKGAFGQAQLMPGTARALEQRYPGLNTSTAYGNILGGAYYLAEQKKRFGSWRLAFAAYNAGPGAVQEYGGVPPFKETRDYVNRTMAALTGRVPKGGAVPTRGAAPAHLGGGGVEVPSSPAAPPPLEVVGLQGLRDLAEGDYSPQRQLSSLRELAEQAAVLQPRKLPPDQHVAPAAVPSYEGPGFTYKGQKLTHDTDGLEGYPAVDLFAPAGTPFLAPEDGRVVRLSGKGGTSGNVYGWSVYFVGKSGRKYFITHLNKQRARGRVKAGQPIGTVSAWESGDEHAHVGIREPRRRR